MPGLINAGGRILAADMNQVALIATTTIATTTASVAFTSIPAFNHLSVLWKTRGDNAAAAVALYCQVNGNVSSGSYIWQAAEAITSTIAGVNAGGTVAQIKVSEMSAAGANSGYCGGGEIIFPYVSDTTNHQICASFGYGPETGSTAYVGTYGGLTSAGVVTSLLFFPSAGNFAAGAMFSLYGWM